MAADLEFFFDPVCPFAWQTSQWIRRVIELEGIEVEWRFISLHFLNQTSYAPDEVGDAHRASHDIGLRYHRLLAAIRAREGSGRLGDLYAAFTGPRFETAPGEGGQLFERPFEDILAEFDLPAELAAEADDPAWDDELRAETELAISRTGPDVGTPILSFGPPTGSSMFGPVISSVPADEDAVELYRAVRTLTDFPGFSELKRTNRPRLDLAAYRR